MKRPVPPPPPLVPPAVRPPPPRRVHVQWMRPTEYLKRWGLYPDSLRMLSRRGIVRWAPGLESRAGLYKIADVRGFRSYIAGLHRLRKARGEWGHR